MSEEKKRNRMVETQLVTRGILDARVLEVMRKVPREHFFPAAYRKFAYCDGAFSIGESQTISQPYMVAKMTECLRLDGEERVLEIGTGSGYQTAILAELAKEVYTIERIEILSLRAGAVLTKLGYTNVKMEVGDGTYGWRDFAPYDCIIVTAGASKTPPALIEQLSRKKGILVIPVGKDYLKILKVITRNGDIVLERDECGCHFVPLVGEYE